MFPILPYHTRAIGRHGIRSFTRPALLSVPLLSRAVFGAAKPVHADPCVKVAGQDFVDPANAIAC